MWEHCSKVGVNVDGAMWAGISWDVRIRYGWVLLWK